MVVLRLDEWRLHVLVELILVAVLHVKHDPRTDATQQATAGNANADIDANVLELIQALIPGLAHVVHATFAAPTSIAALGAATLRLAGKEL